MRLLTRFFGLGAHALGQELANALSAQYPVSLHQRGMRTLSVDRLSRILEDIYASAQNHHKNDRLTVIGRARLANAFRWRLSDLGYSKPFVNLATEGLIVYLSKKQDA